MVAVFRAGRLLGFSIFDAGVTLALGVGGIGMVIAQCTNVNYLIRRASEYRRGRNLPSGPVRTQAVAGETVLYGPTHMQRGIR